MFIDQLLRHAGQRPTAAALVRGGQTVTYAELAERVEADAASLRRQGIAPATSPD